MKKKLLMLVAGVLGLIIIVPTALAATVILPNPLCTKNSNTCIDSIDKLITTISDYILTLIAGLAVIMFIYAAILFLTSAGNEGKLGKAKSALFWAIVGAAISLAGKGLIAVINAVIGTSP